MCLVYSRTLALDMGGHVVDVGTVVRVMEAQPPVLRLVPPTEMK